MGDDTWTSNQSFNINLGDPAWQNIVTSFQQLAKVVGQPVVTARQKPKEKGISPFDAMIAGLAELLRKQGWHLNERGHTLICSLSAHKEYPRLVVGIKRSRLAGQNDRALVLAAQETELDTEANQEQVWLRRGFEDTNGIEDIVEYARRTWWAWSLYLP